MAQLKLMKKEWFNWFDKTFLDNITAWTEYYYINPDSQHWISNNQFPLPEVAEKTTDGITYSIKGNVLKLNGTATRNSHIFMAQDLGIKLPAGTYTLSLFNSQLSSAAFILESSTFAQVRFNVNINATNVTQTQTFTEDVTINNLRMYFNANASFDNEEFYISITKGDVAPDRFNPPLIKIEDILGVVNLGDLGWPDGSQDGWCQSNSLRTQIKKTPNNIKAQVYSNYFTTETAAAVFTRTINNSIGVNQAAYVQVYSEDFIGKTESQIKSLMDGKYIIYVKADSPY